jgi:hypothetical protein
MGLWDANGYVSLTIAQSLRKDTPGADVFRFFFFVFTVTIAHSNARVSRTRLKNVSA